jgi:hypothetical protein
VKAIGFTTEAEDEYDRALAASPDPARFRQVVADALRDIASGLIVNAAVPRTPCRECVLTALPYSIIYIESDDEVRVWAFAHQKRRPGYWKRRLPKK